MRDRLSYFRQRLQAEQARAAASDGIVRTTHEKFVVAYRERLAQLQAAHTTVDELLG